MAFITDKPNGTALVRWRDVDSKERSRIYPSHADAEAALPGIQEQIDARKDPHWAYDPTNPDWNPWPVKEPTPGHTVEAYVRRVIDGDRELRAGSRRQYEVDARP